MSTKRLEEKLDKLVTPQALSTLRMGHSRSVLKSQCVRCFMYKPTVLSAAVLLPTAHCCVG